MKISEITGRKSDTQFDLQFDPAERDRYVSRFLAAFNLDAHEDVCASKVYEIHLEVRARHDLYFAIFESLTPSYCRAIRDIAGREYRRLNERPAHKDPEWFRPG